jgi:hypothetical protein
VLNDEEEGAFDGKEWVWEDQYEVNHICKLHRKRHEAIGSHD